MHAHLENEFREDEKCHNLMRWLNLLCILNVSIRKTKQTQVLSRNKDDIVKLTGSIKQHICALFDISFVNLLARKCIDSIMQIILTKLNCGW